MSEIPEEIRFLHATEMGVGAWAWGDKIIWNYGRGYAEDEIRAAFDVSMEEGIRLVDTAEVYGNGRSEQMIGKFLRETEQPALVATKFMPFPWRLRKQSLLRALERSLKRLSLESVDLYQIHFPLPPMPLEVWMEELAEAVSRGWTRAVGVSNYSQNQMLRAYSALARRGIPLASNQVEYSLLDRRIEKNGLLARAQELGIRVIAYSPLAMGLLTGKYSVDSPPPGARRRKAAKILPKLPRLLDTMKKIGDSLGGKSPAQVAINWCICKGTMPIPGAKNAAQARENAGAPGGRLSEAQIAALDEASDALML